MQAKLLNNFKYSPFNFLLLEVEHTLKRKVHKTFENFCYFKWTRDYFVKLPLDIPNVDNQNIFCLSKNYCRWSEGLPQGNYQKNLWPSGQ